MNSEENHGFTSFDFITMMVSFVVIAAVTGPIIRKNIQSDQSLDRAKNEAQSLGQTLLDPRNIQTMVSGNSTTEKSGRSIASLPRAENLPKLDVESMKAHLKNGEWEGNISTDPWGDPYHFAFLKNAKGIPAYVAVWSDGPDHVSQTSVHGQSVNPNKVGQFECKGDDLCSVTPIR
jgi:hypothetical protein